MALVKNKKRSEPSDQMMSMMMIRPLMLKDYLKLDLGSSSSSGFRSFPRHRHECCVAVQNLIHNQNSTRHRCNLSSSNHRLIRSRSVSASASELIFKVRRASMAILKILPLSSIAAERIVGDGRRKSSNYSSSRLLTRSSSKKVVRRLMWWRSGGAGDSDEAVNENLSVDECRRWRSSSEMTTVTATTTATGSSGESGWSDEVSSSLNCLGCSKGENDVVEKREDLSVVTLGDIVGISVGGKGGVAVGEIEGVTVGKKVGVTDGGDSIDVEKKTCGDEQNKEQFSPVSVLDFSDDYDEGTSSPFICTLAEHFQGTKQNPRQKHLRFNISSLELVNTENRITNHLSQEESSNLSKKPCSSQSKQADQTEPTEKCLVNLVKGRVQSSKYSQFKPDNLLMDFFKNSINENSEALSLKVAEDWLNGCHNELLSGWEVKHKRQAYIRDMEEGRRWTTDSEREEIALGLAAEVFASLSDELLLEICSC